MIKFYTLTLAVLMGFTSCVQYQYLAVNSPNTEKQNNYWSYENDSVRIEYSFSGSHLPVSIRFTNNTGKTLYLDWRKSFVVLNPKFKTNANSENYIYQDSKDLSHVRIPMTKFITDYIVHKVEPYQSVNFDQIYRLCSDPIEFDDFPTKEYAKTITLNGDEAKRARVYSELNTPLYFTQEHTIHFDEVDKNTQNLSHAFYIHKAMNAGPRIMWTKGESITLIRDSSGAVLGVLSLIGLTALFALLLNEDYSGDYYLEDDYDDGW